MAIESNTIPTILRFLFDKQNALYERLGFDEAVNERVSEDYSDAVEAFLE